MAEATHEQMWLVARPTREEHRDHHVGYEHQCLFCAFYHELAGPLGSDWGVCFNADSAYAGMAKFEHQGCAAYVNDGAA